ncbi:hypothetical protein A2765_06120 [Candidatus Kaiserbacteria bacterium RIFCSPHIGHO2_01_FULL_56_24]|uniref:Uncharacterized protein n=1 Tax=Candidatus Kaiserbacteria bacterium RIFCSPHIGHO2_01_FULL_56_24 TaxID=1798487 RepID=A0A1F6D8G0_9BACT|nr:MAG: hypothetical protein A2765_06120 [Candidatus Kaiserbacteria bacterium RIFCSPHIGHO2_01_FULL_56_24]
MSAFPFEDDPLKHHVRKEVWLPACRKRLDIIRSGNRQRNRRLRYFTFCATGAVDVLMLNVENVLTRSASDRFDTVTFFDLIEEDITETEKNIPGAAGIAGRFADVVLAARPEDIIDPLEPPTEEVASLTNLRAAALNGKCKAFVSRFPFDVINLDLYDYLFKNSEQVPGALINALRNVFAWQRREIEGYGPLPGFTLFFTTQIGPIGLNDDYQNMLLENMRHNLGELPELRDLLRTRTGSDDPEHILRTDFETFFKIAAPKFLVHTLQEQDWYVDPDEVFSIVEYSREHEAGNYTMLHIAMQVRRQYPRRENRPPNTQPDVTDAYRRVVSNIFSQNDPPITLASIDKNDLDQHMELIRSRRKKYRKEVGAEE